MTVKLIQMWALFSSFSLVKQPSWIAASSLIECSTISIISSENSVGGRSVVDDVIVVLVEASTSLLTLFLSICIRRNSFKGPLWASFSSFLQNVANLQCKYHIMNHHRANNYLQKNLNTSAHRRSPRGGQGPGLPPPIVMPPTIKCDKRLIFSSVSVF